MIIYPDIATLDTNLNKVLRKMEKTGVKLDTGYLAKLAVRHAKTLEKLTVQIYDLAGHEFLIDSPKQLSGVLYGELHLDEGEVRIPRTKSGKSTAATVLSKLLGTHPIIAPLMEYRETKKLLSTYIEPLPKLVDDNSRLHTTYSIDTAAGRLSSKNPNLQNIPARSEEGREIRKAFVAQEGNEFLSIDYSQIELRIAAHFSQDPNLIKAFMSGDDIHTATSKIMKVDRRVAKAINFGLLFGQAAFGLSETLAISFEEAQEFIDNYFHQFSRLADWMAETKQKAHEKGYAQTLLGRKRYLSAELTSNSYQIRAFAERVALNHPIQGTEAEIMALAMIEIDQQLPSDTKMLLQVHDELLLEVPKGQAKKLAPKVQKIMSNVAEITVPIETEAKIGPNWAEMKNTN
ncbi:hypothetical protein KC644_01585 [Candidatus Berkelbacteria bacterium]|nr:hypothetical protein [Candidatus Berkelbacteria bacterium]